MRLIRLAGAALLVVSLGACGASGGKTTIGAGRPLAAPGSAVPGSVATGLGYPPADYRLCPDADGSRATPSPAPSGVDPDDTAPLPPTFNVAKVQWCASTEAQRNGDTVHVAQLREATGDVSGFVRALREPDQPRPTAGEQMCAAYADIRPQVEVFDATGRGFLPRFPMDACGHLFGDSISDFRGLSYRVLASGVTGLEQSALSKRTGCSDSFKGVDDLGAIPSKSAGGSTIRGSITECDYSVRPNDLDSLTGGGPVGDTRASALTSALGALPAATPCDEPESDFVLLTSRETYVEIERGGCGRVTVGGDTVYAGTRAVTAALALPNS